jgi:hypothetical protein
MRQPRLLGCAHVGVRVFGRFRLAFQQASDPVQKLLEPAVLGMVCHGAPLTRQA